MIKVYRVSFLAGDFNMSLFQVVNQMRNHQVETRWLGPYAWKCEGGASGSANSR